MLLIDQLRAEHELIENVVGSFRTYVEKRSRGEAEPGDGDGFLRFFRDFAGRYHHGREEEILLPALVAQADLAPRSGPIVSILDQHRSMARLLEELAGLLRGDHVGEERGEALVEMATRYSRDLCQHIDAENSVLLPESEERLRRVGVTELPSREATDVEAAARAEGERLARLHPVRYDAGAIRGEGCVICPSYGTTCGGVEREWWNEWEWETFTDFRA